LVPVATCFDRACGEGPQKLDLQEATFADRVQAILDERGLTRVDLAKAREIGQPAISMLLSRRARPRRRTVEKVAKALGVDSSDLWPEAETLS